eukprot:1141962-Pelagomonas_calceolata.AAC.1
MPPGHFCHARRVGLFGCVLSCSKGDLFMLKEWGCLSVVAGNEAVGADAVLVGCLQRILRLFHP